MILSMAAWRDDTLTNGHRSEKVLPLIQVGRETSIRVAGVKKSAGALEPSALNTWLGQDRPMLTVPRRDRIGGSGHIPLAPERHAANGSWLPSRPDMRLMVIRHRVQDRGFALLDGPI